MSLRAAVKHALAVGAHGVGLDALVWRLQGRRPMVVAYHRVVADFERSAATSLPAMLITRGTLERHLDWLGRRFALTALDELDWSGAQRSRAQAAITFDDGYRDVYELAIPLLERKGIPATVFVATELVGQDTAFLHDRLFLALQRLWARPQDPLHALAPRLGAVEAQHLGRVSGPIAATPALLERLPRGAILALVRDLERDLGTAPSAEHATMGWDELRDLVRRGFGVGSHTRHHALLPLESPATCRDEAEGSRGRLEHELGVSVRQFAYPAGCFDASSAATVRAAGYRRGYTICRHADPRHPELTLPRKVLWERTCLDALGRFSAALMSCQVHRVFDRTRCAHPS